MKNEFIYPLRIHIEDTDFTGLVFHSNYLRFMERARSEWGNQLGLNLEWQKQHQIYFVVYSAHLLFLKPARAHQQVEVVTTVKEIRAASVIYDQHLRLADVPDKIFCKASIKIACIGYDMRPCPIPKTPILDTFYS